MSHQHTSSTARRCRTTFTSRPSTRSRGRVIRSRSALSRSALVAALVAASLLLASPAGAVPVPGNTQPPGTDGLITILGWGGWIVGFLGVGGILIVAGMMVIRHQRGEPGENFGKLGIVLAGLVVGSGASLLAGALYA